MGDDDLKGTYRIAGNFRGRKFCELVKNMIFVENTFVNCSLVPHQRTPLLRRTLSQIATKLWTSWKFSPSKVSRYTVCIWETKHVHMYLSILGFANHIVHIASQCIIKAGLLRKSVLQTCQWLHMYIACLFCVALSFVTGPFSHNIILVGKSFVVSHKTLHLMNCFLKKPECAPREQEAPLNTQVLHANHSLIMSQHSKLYL